MWIFRLDPEAQRQLRKVAKTPLKPLYDKAFRELQYSADPAALGRFKGTLRCYAYNVNDSLRILYSVDHEEKVIAIHNLGDKQVYGKA